MEFLWFCNHLDMWRGSLVEYYSVLNFLFYLLWIRQRTIAKIIPWIRGLLVSTFIICNGFNAKQPIENIGLNYSSQAISLNWEALARSVGLLFILVVWYCDLIVLMDFPRIILSNWICLILWLHHTDGLCQDYTKQLNF